MRDGRHAPPGRPQGIAPTRYEGIVLSSRGEACPGPGAAWGEIGGSITRTVNLTPMGGFAEGPYGSSAYLHEEDMARRWWGLPAGMLLPLSDGSSCQLVFAGRSGGAQGPDVRDAVLRLFPLTRGDPDMVCQEAEQLVGDVEFHLRASDWFIHLHHRDARYNTVILHVVLLLDNPTPTLRQDGTIIPTCSLQDVPPRSRMLHVPYANKLVTTWPCQVAIQEMSTEERTRLLRLAGLLRFEQKTHAFVELLHDSHAQAPFDAYDICLILALAEGLGYGRDRAFFRAAGQSLLGLADTAPEPLGRTADPPPLDARRLRILRNLVAQWRTSGAWRTLREAIYPPIHQVIPALRAMFADLSVARSDILICNIVLPFASAVALLEHDDTLLEQARTLYEQYPGLSSNQITRAMCRQLLLPKQPDGACQQQGLHYIYQQTCREKRCGLCIVGRQVL